MLRIRSSKGRASHYLGKETKIAAYYAGGQDMAGRWGGKAAERLGLRGDFQQEAFEMLCRNLNPATGERLTAQTKNARREGYEINLNAPKRVSIVFEYLGDANILAAFKRAERETMEDVERLASVRVRKDGRNEDRITGEIVFVDFTHFTARPENGVPDPHMHSHLFIANATFDPVEQEWKALQIGEIWRNAEYFQALFNTRFAKYLQEAGYEIVRNGKWFDIAGLSPELAKKFSQRAERVMTEARKRGILTAEGRDILAAVTRESKMKELTREELHKLWWPRLTEEDIRELEAVRAARDRKLAQAVKSSTRLGRAFEATAKKPVEASRFDREAVAFAVEHLFERRSVLTELEIVTEAANWGIGRSTVEGIRKAVRDFPLIRVKHQGVELITTDEVVAEERRLVARCRKGRDILPALNPQWRIQNPRLSAEMRAAVTHLLRSRDVVAALSGKAGTGKTTLLHEAKAAIEAAGHRLIVLTPMAQTAHDVLRPQGFENADTIAQLLVNPFFQAEAQGAVWWIDEAGLLSTRQADELLELAEKLGARLVLVGDTGQLQAVERGQAFDLLQRFAGMRTERIEEILRQRGPYKEVVKLVAAGKFAAAFDLMEECGMIEEVSFEDRNRSLAAQYIARLRENKTVLVTSPTHVECDAVKEELRASLKKEGFLMEGTPYDILRNLPWTKAQKRDPRHYAPGQVVRMNQNVKGFERNERLEVIQADEERVMTRRANGAVAELPLSKAGKFSVFEKDTIEICNGERIRVIANGRSRENQRLNNGSFHKVRHVEADGTIVLDNGWHLDRGFSMIDWGYATTAHGCQGKTVDHVFVVQSAISSGASDARQFYVSISRGREGGKVITTDLDFLRQTVGRQRNRPMAMEILQRESARSFGSQGRNIPEDLKANIRKNRQPENAPKEAWPKITPEAIKRAVEVLFGTKDKIAEIEEIEKRRRKEQERRRVRVMKMTL